MEGGPSRAEVFDFSIVTYHKHLLRLQLCVQKDGIPLEKELSEMAKALERGNINDVVQRGSGFAEAICNWFFSVNPTISVSSPSSHGPDFIDKLNTMKRYIRSSNPLLNLLSVFKMMWAAHGSRTSVTNNGDALVVIGAALSTGFYLLEFGLPKPDMTLDRKSDKEKEREKEKAREEERQGEKKDKKDDKKRPPVKAVKEFSKDEKSGRDKESKRQLSPRGDGKERKVPVSPRSGGSQSDRTLRLDTGSMRSPRSTGSRSDRDRDRDAKSEREDGGRIEKPLSARRHDEVKKEHRDRDEKREDKKEKEKEERKEKEKERAEKKEDVKKQGGLTAVEESVFQLASLPSPGKNKPKPLSEAPKPVPPSATASPKEKHAAAVAEAFHKPFPVVLKPTAKVEPAKPAASAAESSKPILIAKPASVEPGKPSAEAAKPAAQGVYFPELETSSMNPASLLNLIEKEKAEIAAVEKSGSADSSSAAAATSSSSPNVLHATTNYSAMPNPNLATTTSPAATASGTNLAASSKAPSKPVPPSTKPGAAKGSLRGQEGQGPMLTSSAKAAGSSSGSATNLNAAWLQAKKPGDSPLKGRGSGGDQGLGPIATVKARFAYTAKQEDELSFGAGTVINVYEKKASGWWEGDINAKRGLFPSNYVEELTSKKCKALFNYSAQEPDELTIAKEDVVTILLKQPNGWWKGELQGRIGVFPANYVSEL